VTGDEMETEVVPGDGDQWRRWCPERGGDSRRVLPRRLSKTGASTARLISIQESTTTSLASPFKSWIYLTTKIIRIYILGEDFYSNDRGQVAFHTNDWIGPQPRK